MGRQMKIDGGQFTALWRRNEFGGVAAADVMTTSNPSDFEK